MTQIPDWLRLKKALTVEAERGFQDLQGNQYRFSEFMTLSLGESLAVGTSDHRRRWQSLAQEFALYPQMDQSQRQALIASTRQFLHQFQKDLETPPEPPKTPKTQPLGIREPHSPTSGNIPPLDAPLNSLLEIDRRWTGDALARLGLYTVRDALFYYPRDHIDYARQVNIAQLVDGETVTIIGTIKSCSCFTSPKNKKLSILNVQLRDRTGQIRLNRFFHGAYFTNRGWQKRHELQYPVGAIAAASGLVKKNKYGITLDNPEIEILDSPGGSIESHKIGRILPVYPLTEGVSADIVRKAILAALPAIQHLKDPLPPVIQNQYSLIPLQQALTHLHFPPDQTALSQARRRLIFDEFFYLQLGFLQRRQQQKQIHNSAILATTGELIEQLKKILPFELTNAQKRVINDILNDLNAPIPMNRLVQGDVGSGKTIVAVFAILAAIQSGYQAALMAPTEVLAEQHYRKLVSWFNILYIPIELLTGSTGVRKRREIHSLLETGELPLLVGTHALIEDPIQFRKLGLVVIDEQHRFGVEQRAKLLAKGKSPHVLTMTATPIPRTLALTLHGDLDVSQIDELPPGRQPIQTTVLTTKQRLQAYELIRREIADGRQAYVILPLIEESDKLDARAAVKEHKRLQEVIFPNLKVGLLHGRMNSAEKDEILTQFRDNVIQIIVSTTVIEVGVDVPNATVMMIENAERFGLSQLHQLRGRVGRGSHKSYCLLMNNGKSPDSQQRLAVLEQSQDGFFISEMDLRLRGPGEVLGKRQSGLSDFALASLVEDQDVLNLARNAAEKMILADENLEGFPSLQEELETRYQKMISGSILT
ncbi:ATP-dependent DNA helicase RecG [Spirulina subsalsa FACHB-351]|uniref:ATP-dependent DNA helicase RecG n=1 Tax=Spirulina subsalsa FACHB-351 TaxID=234711 RepID=A0ABT3L2Z5_9CYAN|nr:ATP-dependent DNA helicase RecG [Spirulina subsalsa]MCW6035562.1 ATP-dependent DNA helicase RecG [Spirulina subsalsa FACHB-351]